MTPYYQDDAVTIYHGDSFNILGQLDVTADLIISDPPYFRVVDAEWDDQWGADKQQFVEWIGQATQLALTRLSERGTIATFCSPEMSGLLEVEIRKQANVLNHIVWRKPGPGRLGKMDKSSLRRFFPTSERIIIAEKLRANIADPYAVKDQADHIIRAEVHAELIDRLIGLRDKAGWTNKDVDRIIGTSGMAGHYFGRSQWSLPTPEAWQLLQAAAADKGVELPDHAELRQEFDGRRQEFDGRRQEFDGRRREFDADTHNLELLSDVWTFNTEAGVTRTEHPTQKPVSLIRHMVGVMSRQGDTVIDPFMGSGTTLRAAKDLGRKAIGIEIDERYCEIAAKRLAQEVMF